MTRVNVAREFGIRSDGGGSEMFSTSELMGLFDLDYDENTKIIAAPAIPSCYGGVWTGGGYSHNIDGMKGYTLIVVTSAPNTDRFFQADGVIRQVGMYGRNQGTASGYLKIKAFRADGIGGLDFVGETNELEIPVESEDRFHVWFPSSPLQVQAGDYLAYYFKPGSSSIYLRCAVNSGGSPGLYNYGDITSACRVADFVAAGYTFVPAGLMATDWAYNTAIVNIDMNGNYRMMRLEVFVDKYTNKELVKIEASNDNTDWLEYVDHKFYTRWSSVEDGNDLFMFNGTRGVVYANIDGAPRYLKVTMLVTCFSGRQITEICALNDPTFIDFKPSDMAMLGGNWIGQRSGTLALSGRTRIDLTEPINQDGYIYGVRVFGRLEVTRTWTFYVWRDKETYLELISTSESQQIDVSGVNEITDFFLVDPMKAKVGDYLGVRGGSDAYIMYDANATATLPWGDPTNNGSGGIFGGVTVSNATTETESWTIECIDSSVPNGEEWTVTGTVSGLQASHAFTGVQYTSDNGEVQFTIQGDPPNYFTVGDKIYFDTIEQGSHWSIIDSSVTGVIGQQILKTSFQQDQNYNIAMRINQDIWTDEIWCNDAEIGAAGEAEIMRVYNKTTEYAEAYTSIEDQGDKDLIEISVDGVNFFGYGDAGLPARIKDRHDPLEFRIAPNDYGEIWVRTNLPSGVDEERQARVLVWWSIVT